MKVSALKVAALVVTAISASSFASQGHDHSLCSGFVPDNEMKIPVGQVRSLTKLRTAAPAGLTQEQFNQVIDRAEKIYAPIITEHGGTLRVNRKWTDETVNASAQQIGSSWIVNMYGGLARHAAINTEGFALVVCHEIGHHIGGAPKKADWWGGVTWATNEGGADYFATLKCLRNFFAEDDNEAIVAASSIDPLAKEQCEQQFSRRSDQLICMRNSMAALSVGYLFQDLRKETTAPKFDTPDTNVVREMMDRHPDTQCRVDTYYNGGLCQVDVTVPVSQTDYREGSCTAPNDTMGLRPLCWFKAPEAN